jgi:hypothetical protein
MKATPGSGRLAMALLASMLILITAAFTGCGTTEDSDKITGPVNEDTVRYHTIPIALAREYTANFRASIDSFNHSARGFQDSMRFGHAEAFPSDVFIKLMGEHNEKQGKAVGIRIYYGRDNVTGEIRLVLVPYDSKGNDMVDHLADINGRPAANVTPLHTEALKVSFSNGQAMDEGQRCPTLCDDGGSGLN